MLLRLSRHQTGINQSKRFSLIINIGQQLPHSEAPTIKPLPFNLTVALFFSCLPVFQLTISVIQAAQLTQ